MTVDRGEDPIDATPLGVASTFRDLRAYRLAAELSDELHNAVLTWPAFERWSLGMQLVRAADSVGANIAEATGRWHLPDKRRLLFIARGSLHEAEHWLIRAERRGLVKPDASNAFDEVGRALNGLIARPGPR